MNDNTNVSEANIDEISNQVRDLVDDLKYIELGGCTNVEVVYALFSLCVELDGSEEYHAFLREALEETIFNKEYLIGAKNENYENK